VFRFTWENWPRDGPTASSFGAGVIWVAYKDDDTVRKFDWFEVDILSVGNGPKGIAFGGANIWVANYYADTP